MPHKHVLTRGLFTIMETDLRARSPFGAPLVSLEFVFRKSATPKLVLMHSSDTAKFVFGNSSGAAEFVFKNSSCAGTFFQGPPLADLNL